jgi:polyketide synthase PksN
MTPGDLLDAYRKGELTNADLREKLQGLKERTWPLSEGQKGLWAIQQRDRAGTQYNVPLCFELESGITEETFRQACRATLRRFPILGSLVRECDGEPRRAQHPSQRPPVSIVDVAALSQEELRARIEARAREAFALDRDFLIRFFLYLRGDRPAVALIVVHHIVFDGGSVLPLLSSFLAACGASMSAAPAPEAHSYDEFVD